MKQYWKSLLTLVSISGVGTLLLVGTSTGHEETAGEIDHFEGDVTIHGNLSVDHAISLGDHVDIGSGNTVSTMDGSLAVGKDNRLETGTAKMCAAIGEGHLIQGLRSVGMGYHNYVNSYNCLAVGYWCAITTHKSQNGGDDGLFVVGNGTGGNHLRRSAFVVNKDGDVIVPSNVSTDDVGDNSRFEVLKNGDVIIGREQGDIEMGVFGN